MAIPERFRHKRYILFYILFFFALNYPLHIMAEGELLGQLQNINATTVIMTHGLQPGDTFINSIPPAWVSTMSGDFQYYKNMTSGKYFNVLNYHWPGAYVPCTGDCNLVDILTLARSADNYTSGAGFDLARQLLGKGTDGPIHLIGHSLGTHVNAFASLALTALGKNVSQVTI